MLLWLKHKFWEKGIGPEEFKKCQIRDIQDIMDMDEAINNKRIREGEIEDTIAKMKR